MDTLYRLVQERNARETLPFEEIHHSWNRMHQEDLEGIKLQVFENVNPDDDGMNCQHEERIDLRYAESTALQNERKIMEELERLHFRVKAQDERHKKDLQNLENEVNSRAEFERLYNSQKRNVSELQERKEQLERALEHHSNKVSDCEQRAKLAEQQYVCLKDTIRILQEENDALKKQNRKFEFRMIEEKDRLSSEVNNMNEMVEQLKRETQMLRSLQKQEEKRTSWFGLTSSSKETTIKLTPSTESIDNTKSSSGTDYRNITLFDDDRDSQNSRGSKGRRKFGSLSIVVPSEPKNIIQAHRKEAVCVRYDDDAGTTVVTGGSDGAIKLWNTSDGSVLATFNGGSSNSIISCDATNQLVAGGGIDKTCRVWNIKSQRMVHQLVGHLNKITCVRFLNKEKEIVTVSADRQMKIWDISKQTYRQTTSIGLSSTANSIDINDDSSTIVSGHVDGRICFWDVRTAKKNSNQQMKNVHENAITSVQLNPLESSLVLSNGMDSRIKIIDIRMYRAVHTFSHPDFRTSYNWSSSVYSPDGAYVASGSSSNGFIFVWDAKNGNLVQKVNSSASCKGLCGVAWGRGGNNGQQFATVDKSGSLILWS